MAELTGKGVLSDVRLDAVILNNSGFTTKSGKTGNAYVQFRLNADDPRAVGQPVPELRSVVVGTNEAGKKIRQRQVAVYAPQVEQIKEAAGDKVYDVKNREGDVIGKGYVFNADLTVVKAKVGAKKYGAEGRVAPDSYLAPKFSTIHPTNPDYEVIVDGTTPYDRSFAMLKELERTRKAEALEAKAVETPEAPEVAAAIEEVAVEAPEADFEQEAPF